ncbi:MAG: hypothetical protein K0S53_3256 [Bacteroidetes bacterium]|jgi:hypothetical protein|nr:hypothetical protein [Bacteroidota bacterium]
MRYLIILTAIALCSFKSGENQLKEIRSVFDRLNTLPSSSKESCYMHYTVISVANNKEMSNKPLVSKADFEVFASEKQNRIYNREIIVLKDQSNTFTILPSRKTIYISDAVVGKKNETLYDKLKVIQDSVFANAEKIETEIVKDKAYNKIISITLNKRLSSYLEIKKISYYIQSEEKLLNRVFVEYIENKPYVSVDYIFNKTDFACKKEDMSESVKKLVFVKNNKLIEAYRGFKVIDSRKK